MAKKKRGNHRKLNMILPPKTKKKTMDPKLLAADEVYYISSKYKIPASKVRAANKKVGRSRARVYAELRAQGYEIKTRRYK